MHPGRYGMSADSNGFAGSPPICFLSVDQFGQLDVDRMIGFRKSGITGLL